MTAPSRWSRSRNAPRACGSTNRSTSNGRTSSSLASTATPNISFKCGFAAIVWLPSSFIVPMYTPSWTDSNSRANALAEGLVRVDVRMDQ